ncbi:unnamed protein product [Cuscuta campestris]|uniref:Uncharacterized protein n=1 Tax=Cuscuta campestris TaxID=132261 RepID=A0A484K9X2_9ASTE|nr:unnamed protein product [Cuscuta campestris]
MAPASRGLFQLPESLQGTMLASRDLFLLPRSLKCTVPTSRDWFLLPGSLKWTVPTLSGPFQLSRDFPRDIVGQVVHSSFQGPFNG